MAGPRPVPDRRNRTPDRFAATTDIFVALWSSEDNPNCHHGIARSAAVAADGAG
jgi:hypothetical protein